MYNKIYKLLYDFFSENGGRCFRYGYINGETISVDEAIKKLFIVNDYLEDDFSVELVHIATTEAVDCYCLCISWFNCGRVNKFNIGIFN